MKLYLGIRWNLITGLVLLACMIGVMVNLPQIETSASAQSVKTPTISKIDSQESIEDSTSIQDRSIEWLIDHMPKAGCEGRWDNDKNEYIENPASKEMRLRLEDGASLTDLQWKSLLQKSGTLVVRERWPSDLPFAVSMTSPLWLGLSQTTATADHPNLQKAQVGELFYGMSGTFTSIRANQAKYQVLGKLDPGKHCIAFEVQVVRGRSWTEEKNDNPVIWEGRLDYNIEIVPNIDNAIPPVNNKAVEKAVIDSLGIGARMWWINERDTKTAYIVLDPNLALYPSLTECGLCLKVEVLHNGDVKEQKWLLASRLDELATMNSLSKTDMRFYDSTNLQSIPVKVISDYEEIDDWVVRVSGVSEHAIYLWDAKTRWGGIINIPLRELVKREFERVGSQGRSAEVSTPRFR